MIMRLAHLALAVVSTSALAVFAAACSDPVPPTPQGAWSVQLVNNDAAACKIIGHAAELGSVTSGSKDNVLVSGALVSGDPVDISCQVTGTSSFEVTGLARLSGQGLQITIPKIDSSATKEAPAKGAVSFNSLKTAGAYSSSEATPCDFFFAPGTGEGVASGRIWVAFSCPKVDDAMSTCSLAESFVIFENCTE
jgi:hypothetical protein